MNPPVIRKSCQYSFIPPLAISHFETNLLELCVILCLGPSQAFAASQAMPDDCWLQEVWTHSLPLDGDVESPNRMWLTPKMMVFLLISLKPTPGTLQDYSRFPLLAASQKARAQYFDPMQDATGKRCVPSPAMALWIVGCVFYGGTKGKSEPPRRC